MCLRQQEFTVEVVSVGGEMVNPGWCSEEKEGLELRESEGMVKAAGGCRTRAASASEASRKLLWDESSWKMRSGGECGEFDRWLRTGSRAIGEKYYRSQRPEWGGGDEQINGMQCCGRKGGYMDEEVSVGDCGENKAPGRLKLASGAVACFGLPLSVVMGPPVFLGLFGSVS